MRHTQTMGLHGAPISLSDPDMVLAIAERNFPNGFEDRLLGLKETCGMASQSPSELYRKLASGDFPAGIMISANRRAWLLSSVLVYTSPSHTPERPKWRILLPCSAAMEPARRGQLLGFVAGLFHVRYGADIFDPASWTASQSYYYGCIHGHEAQHRVELIDGEAVDQAARRSELWRPKPCHVVAPPNDAPSRQGEVSASYADIGAIRHAICSGTNYHAALLTLAASLFGRGHARDAVEAELLATLDAVPPEQRDRRWERRRAPGHIGRLLDWIEHRENQKQTKAGRDAPEDAAEPQRARSNGDAGAEQSAPLLLPPPGNPVAVAYRFVAQRCRHDGELTLRRWRGRWWTWLGRHWRELDASDLRIQLYGFTKQATCASSKGPVPWLPTAKKISDLIDALSEPVWTTAELEQPCWLDGRHMVGPVIATANGLLEIDSATLHPHSPLFFNLTSVPFAYQPKAPAPQRWLDFLAAIWPQQPDAVKTLGEWFGYVVSGRTDLQKILLMIGPTRGGKGTIARILSALIGSCHVAGPTFNSLGDEFGLAPLMGKSLAIISDARFSGRNNGLVIERLLSISGEDILTINAKYREQWTGKLPCRLHILSNEEPHLRDASSAIVDRFVPLKLTRSWLDREDHTLEPELHLELPSILNWALDGLARLGRNDGHFTCDASSAELITELRELSSPVRAFVNDRCEIGPDRSVVTTALYEAYRIWCEANQQPIRPKHVFGRDLRAAFPEVQTVQPWAGGVREREYVGVSLRENVRR